MNHLAVYFKPMFVGKFFTAILANDAKILFMNRFDMFTQYISVSQHLSTVRTRVRPHDFVVGQDMFLERIFMGEGLTADLTDMIFWVVLVETLLMPPKCLH